MTAHRRLTTRCSESAAASFGEGREIEMLQFLINQFRSALQIPRAAQLRR